MYRLYTIVMDLTQRKCVACEGDVPPLNKVEAEVLAKQTPGWSVSEDAKELRREFKFKNFAQALAFTNKVGDIAESEGHHPDIEMGWGYVRIKLTTHAIKGLSENDFIVAAKIDLL
jgi:4a-hydroxytetrahydrobiopterin dehydratase